jgi:O-antigen ligase
VGLLLIGVALAMLLLPIAKEGLSRFKRDRFVSEAEMEQSVQLRPMLATVAVEMIKDHPLQGTGFGLYHKFKRPYHFSSDSGLPLQKVLVYTQHNVFLVYLVETGVVGLAGFLGLFVVAAIRCLRLSADASLDWEQRQLGLLGLSAVSIYLINGMYHDVSIIPAAHTMLLMIVGVVGQIPLKSIDVAKHARLRGFLWKENNTPDATTGLPNQLTGEAFCSSGARGKLVSDDGCC